MKLSNILMVAVLSAIVAFGVVKVTAPNGAAPAAQAKETAYQRVMRTGTLKCGYAILPYFFEKDPNTGKFSGFYYDLLEELGKRLSLKIEWAEEVGLATAFEGLKTNRYDSVCMPFFATPGRARVAEFTNPFVYLPYYAYARIDDKRFDADITKANDPSIKIAVLEGELSQAVKNEDFPLAGVISLPNLADTSQVFIQVVTNKADIFFAEPSTEESYSANSPGKVKKINAAPIRLGGVGLSVAVGEEELKALLNTTIETLHSTGYIQRLFIKSEKDKDFYYLPAQPWRRVGN